jgi:hypothetical protein
METVTVNVRRAGESHAAQAVPDLETDLARARRLAQLMDAQFSFMGIPFGLDAIIGLVPVAGDAVTALVSLYPIWVAKRHNLGKVVQGRMVLNVLVDGLAGLVPLVGDAVDIGFKANLKNLKLLERAAERKRRK